MSTTRAHNDMILADLIALRAQEQPEFDVLTFEHLSLDGGTTPDEVRTYADLAENANRIAAGLIELGMEPGERFTIMMRNHPEFIETMIAASITRHGVRSHRPPYPWGQARVHAGRRWLPWSRHLRRLPGRDRAGTRPASGSEMGARPRFG